MKVKNFPAKRVKSKAGSRHRIKLAWREKFLILSFSFSLFVLHFTFSYCAEEPEKPQPIIVNGDTVEYSTESKDFTATGNVVVVNQNTKLTCRTLTLNSATKDCQAEGDVRLDDGKMTIDGSKLTYNFETKKGIIFDSAFRANPYFGRAEKQVKVSDDEFQAMRSYLTTCNFNKPHWKMKSKKMNFFPGDKVQVRDSVFFVRDMPLLYMPQYNRSLKDPIMKVQMMPGTDKNWGSYMLTAWRYNFTEDLKGRIYLDYRSNYGIAEGLGINYDTEELGKGDFKFYYTQERNKSKKEVDIEDVNSAKVFQRYFVRLRHKWTIDETSNALFEYYKITDSKRFTLDPKYNILKDYFPREYEKDTQPPSYAQYHRSFSHASLDLMMQLRVNNWYAPGYLDKLPEIAVSLPSLKIFNLPVYFENSATMGNYNQRNTSTSTPTTNIPDAHVTALDMTNRLSFPLKVAFLQLTPYISNRETFFDKDIRGESIPPRTVFSSGSDISTKFYRLFNIKTNLLGLNINALRHIVTPTATYNYTNYPTIANNNLRQVYAGSVTPGQSAAFELSNKFQTKRGGQSTDIVDFRINTSYIFKTKTGSPRGGSFSDLLFKLELTPYSWMSFYADTTYKHSGDPNDVGYKHFTNVNYNWDFSFAPERTFGLGQRYAFKGGNIINYNIKWRLNPKWRFELYHYRNIGHDPTLMRGLREQEYKVTRDFHCWEVDLSYRRQAGRGDGFWIVFRLKAFPDLEFDYNRRYNEPKPGQQRSPN